MRARGAEVDRFPIPVLGRGLIRIDLRKIFDGTSNRGDDKINYYHTNFIGRLPSSVTYALGAYFDWGIGRGAKKGQVTSNHYVGRNLKRHLYNKCLSPFPIRKLRKAYSGRSLTVTCVGR